MNRDDNKLVFVSYAHTDEDFLKKELMPFLRQLELGEQIELWHDQLIGTGEDWYAEIADRLDHAKVAILLITPAFLGSKFCHHEEVPVLLQRVRRGELRVLPLFAEPALRHDMFVVRGGPRKRELPLPPQGQAQERHGQQSPRVQWCPYGAHGYVFALGYKHGAPTELSVQFVVRHIEQGSLSKT